MLHRHRIIALALIAVMCLGLLASAVYAAIYSIPFFSQRDARWSGNRLGTCSTTIGEKGCAVTSMAMILAYRGAPVDPGKLNAWLTSNNGYASGCLIKWDVATRYNCRSWLGYQGSSTLPDLKTLSSLMANRKLIISTSYRGGSHFTVILGVAQDGTGYYWDPWDLSPTCRRVNDGWVNVGNPTQVFGYDHKTDVFGSPLNAALGKQSLPMFTCPSDHEVRVPPMSWVSSNMAANREVMREGMSLASCTDGTTTTGLAIEVLADKGLPQIQGPAIFLGVQETRHPQVFHLLFVGGAVKAIAETVDPQVMQALGTPSGGEVITGAF